MLVTSISVFPTSSVSAGDLEGSGQGTEASAGRPTKTDMKGALTGIATYRAKMIVFNDKEYNIYRANKKHDYGYFSLEYRKKMHRLVFNMKPNITKARGYSDFGSWFYFYCDGDSGRYRQGKKLITGNGKKSTTIKAYGSRDGYSEKMKTFSRGLLIKGTKANRDGTAISSKEMLKSFEKINIEKAYHICKKDDESKRYKKPYTKAQAWAIIKMLKSCFKLTSKDLETAIYKYHGMYLVVEKMQNFGDGNVWYTATPHTIANNGAQTAKTFWGKHNYFGTTYGQEQYKKWVTGCEWGRGYCLKEGKTLPFHADRKGDEYSGYCVFSLIPPIPDPAYASANVALEYQGDAGTSDHKKFVVASTVTTDSEKFTDEAAQSSNGDGKKGKYTFYSVADHEWLTAKYKYVTLRFDQVDKFSKNDKIYTVLPDFANLGKYKNTKEKLSAEELVSKADNLDTSKLKLKWGFKDVSRLISDGSCLGYTSSVDTLNDKVSTAALKNLVAKAWSDGTTSGFTKGPVKALKELLEGKLDSKVTRMCMENLNSARKLSDEDCFSYSKKTVDVDIFADIVVDDEEPDIENDVDTADYSKVGEEENSEFDSTPEPEDEEEEKESKTERASVKGYLEKNKNLGVAYELIVKGSPITSHLKHYSIKGKGSDLSVSKPKEIGTANYTSSSYGTFDVKSYWVAVPNSKASATEKKIPDILKSVKSTTSAGTIISKLKTGVGTTLGKNTGGKVYVGSTKTKTVEGYTIYTFDINATPIPPEPGNGDAKLHSFMLNRYFKNIIEHASTNQGATKRLFLHKDFTVIRENYHGSETCPRCGATLKPTTAPIPKEDWRLDWNDSSSGTTETSWDSGKLLGRYFLQVEGNWDSCKRDNFHTTWTNSRNTKSWSSWSNYRIDYAFNLVRAASGDKRSISGIRYASYEEGTSNDTDNMLKIRDQFGVVPKVKKAADVARDPHASVGNVLETLVFNSRFTRYAGAGYDERVEVHHHNEVSHTETHTDTITGANGKTTTISYTVKVIDKPEVNISYFTFPTKIAQGFDVNHNQAMNSFTFKWYNAFYKYSTQSMPEGLNNTLDDKDEEAIEVHSYSPTSGHVKDNNEYRFASVQYNNTSLSFYPDVRMVYLNGGKTWGSVSGSNSYKITYVMGEEKRKTKSSSLYLYKLNGTGDGAITGTTYSDAMQGGSSTLGQSKVMIPAGSDVSVASKLDGVTIDLYGYALDTIDKNFDYPTYKTGVSTTRAYTSVVKSGLDIYNSWMGSSNKNNLKTHFASWTNTILDTKNYSADFELIVNNDLKSENFSAVVGNVSKKDVAEDGVYQLEVENGALLEDGGDFQEMIAQIAADYQCSTAQAKDIWYASGIHTAILNAIESSRSSVNKSGTCDEVNSAWTSQLGNDTNWYDEKTRTFVVRRFTRLGNKFNDITATDKIDYNLAPDGNLNDAQNKNAGINYDAKWKLNLFFNKDEVTNINKYLVGNGAYYDPSTSTNKATPKDGHTLLINEAPVKNADFLIPAQSTSDFGD